MSQTKVKTAISLIYTHTGSRLALAVAPPSLALPPTKVVTARASQGEMGPMLASGPAVPPKPLGTPSLGRDASTQGHAFKTRIGN